MKILGLISNDLLVPSKMLARLIASAPHRYKVYPIMKKSGKGTRTIAQPARSVKTLQRWVMKNVLAEMPVHEAAIAYVKGKGIRQNAAMHAPHRFLMKLDFQDFFPSITAEDFVSYVHESIPNKFGELDLLHLKKILFWNRARQGNLVMSIGAPSSPMLSNILMYRFDEEVYKFCAGLSVTYTRYADDLTFSTSAPDVLRIVKHEVERICLEQSHPKLTLNEAKTVHSSRKKLRQVTGLVLTNEGTVSLGRDRKRIIRSTVHRFVQGKLNDEEISRLQGMLAFVNTTEPEFLIRLNDHYGEDHIAKLLRFRKARRGTGDSSD